MVSDGAEEKTPGDGLSAGNLSADADAVPQQLRRRREAAKRLTPLDDGRRDPLDVPYDNEPQVIVICYWDSLPRVEQLRKVWMFLHRHGLMTDVIEQEFARLANEQDVA